MKKMHSIFGLFIVATLLIACGTFSKTNHRMGEKKYLALGDSYTIGESVSKSDRFPEQLVAALNEQRASFQSPEIIARTGWRTDQLIAAMDQAELSESYDLVTVLIGVNNEFQGKSSVVFESELRTICQRAIQLAGGKKNVYILSIPDYGYTPFGQTRKSLISDRIDEFNAVVQSIADELEVNFVDVTSISRLGLKQKGLIADDGLHPSGRMYEKWVEKIIAAISD